MAMRSKRIYGIETEFGVLCAGPNGRVLSAEDTSRYLFRGIVAGGRSSNAFLANGSRIYLDVGSHPEYATAECDDLKELVACDRAGESLLAELAIEGETRLKDEGIDARIHLFKNNSDSAGNSYGSHENYLIDRQIDFPRLVDGLLPFLVSRQILVGAGCLATSAGEPGFAFSQRADHMWESQSSSSTKARPLINTRDEPHADSERFRRLHVIVGDSNMSETTTWLKVAMTELVLQMLEAGGTFRDLKLANPMRAIRAVSHGFLSPVSLELADGGKCSATDLQREYLTRARRFFSEERIDTNGDSETLDRYGRGTARTPAWASVAFDLWERGICAVEDSDPGIVDTELDWAIKFSLLDRYRRTHDVDWSDPRVHRLNLAYHEIAGNTGIFRQLEQRGLAQRLCVDSEIANAMSFPPQTTRARLRGEFIRRARECGRDYSVDWVHLKLGDAPNRAIALKDPFAAYDERVDRLMALL